MECCCGSNINVLKDAQILDKSLLKWPKFVNFFITDVRWDYYNHVYVLPETIVLDDSRIVLDDSVKTETLIRVTKLRGSD
ncbi:hypothetical protein IEQ34_020602 [Dendrobium chrysotoxum]|uniref:Uncharacterized protein n=1 Tax=Dendrobium chrysotoxum TaxID=161865 RepID=A0AAV7FKK8_DENCH|nr:hypothetical protein IEQ34_020602 [Dendrobium chrysotoxum]